MSDTIELTDLIKILNSCKTFFVGKSAVLSRQIL